MPMVPVYKLETLKDLDEIAENGGWRSHKEMCTDVNITPEEFLGTYQECDGAYGFEGEEYPVRDENGNLVHGLFVTWFGSDHFIVRDKGQLFTDANGNLFACMEVELDEDF